MSDPKVIEETTLFDLPMPKQLEIMKRNGFSDYDEWVAHEKETDIAFDKHVANFQWGVRPEGFTEEDAERFTEKCQSGHGTEKIIEAD